MIIRVRTSKGTSRLEVKGATVAEMAEAIAQDMKVATTELQIALDFQSTTKLAPDSRASLSSVGIEHGTIVYISVLEAAETPAESDLKLPPPAATAPLAPIAPAVVPKGNK
jgi:hypothetical protein